MEMNIGRVVTFDSSLKKEILSIFGKDVDDNDYIVEKDNPEEQALTPDGEPITIHEFAGLTKGSLRFVKSDLVSLLQFADNLL